MFRSRKTGAETLAAWLTRRATRAGRVLAIEEAILSGRFVPYALRRLSAFAVARGWAIGMHVLELTWLAGIFSAKQFVASVAVSNATMVLDALYFGALEGMRRRLRELGPTTEAAALTSRWLTFSIWLGAVFVLVPLVNVASKWGHGDEPPSMFVVYALLVGVRFALDVTARTYYSGVYAFHRVYRPLYLPMITPTLAVGLTVVLWDAMKGWAFPAALFVSVVVSRSLLVLYTRRAYRFRRVPPPRLRLVPRWSRRANPERHRALRMGVLAALANTTTRIGAVVLIAAIVPSLGSSADVDGAVAPFAYALHAATPLLYSSGQWGLVFYHDWKRVEGEDAQELGRFLHRRILVTAVVVALVAWLAACALVTLWVPLETSGAVLAALLPSMLGLSVWTALQLRGFARGEFLRQVASACAMLAVLWIALASEWLGLTSWYVALAAGPWAAIALHGMLRRVTVARARGNAGTLAVFSRTLGAERGPVVVWQARAAARASRTAARIEKDLGPSGAVVRMGARILWYQRGDDARTIGRRAWLERTCGALSEIEGAAATDGPAALVHLSRRGSLLAPAESPDLEALGAAHARIFPEGFVLWVGRSAPPRYVALASPIRQAIWRDAVRAQRGNRGRSGWFVTAYAPEGATKVIFAAPRPVTSEQATAWYRLLWPHGWRVSPDGGGAVLGRGSEDPSSRARSGFVPDVDA